MKRTETRSGDRVSAMTTGLVLVCLLLLGCSSNGTFTGGPWYRWEALELNSDGSFRYVDWSDDGGRVCSASGTWERDRQTRSIRTTVSQVIPGTQPTCPRLLAVAEWQRQGSRLHRRELPDLKRTWRRMPADLNSSLL
jgi:hypothetical protein